MWTNETKIASLILEKVKDPTARRLLYQAQVNYENFRNSSQQLHVVFEQLLFQDFSRVNSCHMTEGVFGSDIHAAEMESAQIRVWGLLLNTATSGHKMLRCVANARSKDRNTDWKVLNESLRILKNKYRRARNFLEHFDEAVNREEIVGIDNCRFHRKGYLEFDDKNGQFVWCFTKNGLAPVEAIWHQLIEMLSERENAEKAKPT